MSVNFRAILAMVALSSFAVACSTKGVSNLTSVDTGAHGRNASPFALAYDGEMKKYEPEFDSSKTFLTTKIKKITLDGIAPVGTDDLDTNSSYVLSGSLSLRGFTTKYQFVSDKIPVAFLRSGKIFDVQVQDEDVDLERQLGGLLSVKARCMDTECKTVSMWLMSYQLGRTNSAGVIFTEKNGAFVIGFRGLTGRIEDAEPVFDRLPFDGEKI